MQHRRMHTHGDVCTHANCLIKVYLTEFDKEEENSDPNSLMNEIFLNYLFDDNTKVSVRTKALEVLI